jgi:allantoicase
MEFEQQSELSARRMGGTVCYSNDEFFAAADHLIADHAPSFEPATFGPKGQIYDGWETRRRREPGHDYAVVRLGAAGVIAGVVVDTAHFLGNYPPEISVEACGQEGYPAPADLEVADWVTIVPRSSVGGGRRNPFTVTDPARFTHVRLSIYPDGGVARLHVFGTPVPDPRLLVYGICDLAAAELGGAIEASSDTFYGPAANILLPGNARTMGEGWETARRRDGGNEWAVVRLAARGTIGLVDLDTTHFKGNAPGSAALAGRDGDGDWRDLLARTPVRPDTRHLFALTDGEPVTHVRLSTFPDGGLARLRLVGRIAPDAWDELILRWFNALPSAQATDVLVRLGRPSQLLERRPLSEVGALRWTT